MNKCEKCGFLHYRTDPCRVAKKSTAARKDVLTNRPGRAGSTPASSTTRGDMGKSEARPTAGTQALPVDTTPKLGRPRIHADRKAYKAQKERERRARLKAEREGK